MAEQAETYIGDGVYASFDGWQIKLATDRGGEMHVIYLDADTFGNLLQFANREVRSSSSHSPASASNQEPEPSA